MQSRRNKKAAKKVFKNLLKRQQYVPRAVTTDKLTMSSGPGETELKRKRMLDEGHQLNMTPSACVSSRKSQFPIRTNCEYLGKVNTIATLITVIVITIVLAYIGNAYIKTEKDKDINRYVIDIALSILGQKPIKENIDSRKWAINVINFYSSVRMHKAAQEELLHKIRIDRGFNPTLLDSICQDLNSKGQ